MTKSDRSEPVGERADHPLRVAENCVYVAAAIVLGAGAVIILGATTYHLFVDLSDGAEVAVTTALDGLLLVFILLELLAGVRATMAERKLVAEPFLIVGIIASIKEILVVALQAKESRGENQQIFDDAMVEIGVLGTLVLVLAFATYFIRLKEREPEEN
ncbi:MAG TPA: phosphate-starvation-inducible PsiE family protein [Acidimicrobiales bacterium]|nr:phosphate-starvation-inducible PsiE family protein [Acidimicrobiales bacterium]